MLSTDTIQIEFTTDIELIQSIYPLIANPMNDYLLIFQGSFIVGMFEIQPITRITGMVHLHIKDEYQNQGIATQAFFELIEFLKGSTYKSLIGSIPEKNKNILKIVKNVDAKLCGIVKNGIIYEDLLQDLYLYQYEIE